MQGDRTLRRLTQESRPFSERSAMVSPDGRWVAFVSNESGRDEIYVRPFPGPGGRHLISNTGGRGPLWGADAGELFYRSGPRTIAARIEARPELSVVGRTVLFENPDYYGPFIRTAYDYDPRSQRFLMVRNEDTPDRINVVLNWFEELRQRAPEGR